METSSEQKPNNVAAIVFAAAALVTVAALLIHPEETLDEAGQMKIIRDHEVEWRVSHWIGNFSLPILAAASLALLVQRTRPFDSRLGSLSLAAAAVFFTLSTLVTLVEASVMPDAALRADAATFHTWRQLNVALVAPFGLSILSLAGVAFSQLGSQNSRTGNALAAMAGIGGVLSAVGLISTSIGALDLHALKMAGLLPFLYCVFLGARAGFSHRQPDRKSATVAA